MLISGRMPAARPYPSIALSSGAKSTVSRCHQVQYSSIAPPSCKKVKHRAAIRREIHSIVPPAIGRDIQALRYHRVQYPSIAPPATGHKIQALRRRPSGAIFKCCVASYRAQNRSIVPPAIGRDIKASHRHQAQN
jgi:hypothetical protein